MIFEKEEYGNPFPKNFNILIDFVERCFFNIRRTYE